jgi:hypothetical protein
MFDENYNNTDNNDIVNSKNDKKVVEKGKGVGTRSSNKLREIIEEFIVDLEYKTNRKLTEKKKRLLMNIAVENYHKRGVTKKTVKSILKISTDYSEKIIYELCTSGLIVASNQRKGRMMTYFLSNMQDYIPVYVSDNKNISTNTNGSSCLEHELMSILFKYLTINKGVFHNFRLLTKLDDKNDYNLLKVSDTNGWTVKSERNKTKVRYTRLTRFRQVQLQVSPNGTVEIIITCSRTPYDLHHDIGLSEFFADLGKIELMLEGAFGFSFPVEPFYQWHIVKVDYNYDIEDIDVRYLSTGNTILQVRHLSRLFQFYTKQLPDKGLVLRIEEQLSFSKPYKPLDEFLKQIRDIEHS